MTPTGQQRCAMCLYWKRAKPGGKPAIFGQCRRLPPMLGPAGTTAFPMPSQDEWCGEWKSVIEQTYA